MLYIICQKTDQHRQAIQASLKFVGITDYIILDPKYYQLENSYPYLLILGQDNWQHINAQLKWNLPEPLSSMSTVDKGAFINQLMLIKKQLATAKERDNFRSEDLPSVQALDEFINSKVGRVIEITLPDRRRAGIYPDNEQLKNQYDIEYHASTVVNLAKIVKLFNATKIKIKDC
jgi:hypothetical protein